MAISVTDLGTVNDTGTNDSDFAFGSFGTESSDRILVALMSFEDGATNFSISGNVVIGGVTANKVQSDATSITTLAVVGTAAVPTGASGNVTADISEAITSDQVCSLLHITGAGSATPHDSDSAARTDAGTTISATVDCPAGGVVIAVASYDVGTQTVTWSLANEVSDEASTDGLVRHSAAYEVFATEQTGLTVTATFTGAGGGDRCIAVVSLASKDVTVVPTGVAGTGAVGDITVSGKANVPLTGVAGTGEVGTLLGFGPPDPMNTTDGPLGGQALGKVAQGTDSRVSIAVTASVTGVAGTGAVGDITVSGKANVPLTGVEGTGAVGDITISGKANVPITGVAGTGEVGTLQGGVFINVTLTGVSATGEVGTLAISGKANVGLTGVAGTGEVGTLIASIPITLSLTGVSATGSVGDLTVSGKANVALTGVAGTGEIGTLTVSAEATVTLDGVAATGSVGDITVIVATTGTLHVTIGEVTMTNEGGLQITGTARILIGNVI